jgi:hypothetical protein
VYVTAEVVEEARFYRDVLTGQHHRIDLQPDVDAGRIRLLSGDEATLANVYATCSRHFAVHEGEAHSLAALQCADKRCRFCTADKAAIQALVLLDLKDRAISLSRLLGDSGVRLKEPLARQFGEEYLTRWLREGGTLKAES